MQNNVDGKSTISLAGTGPAQKDGGSPKSALDLLIVGAGISGIDLAHHVAKNFPGWSWQVIDKADDLGGTWHTFRYPGIRSDSDMATFGFPFLPWPHPTTLGHAPDIKDYIKTAARNAGALDRLRLNTRVDKLSWDSKIGLWSVTVSDPREVPRSDKAEQTIYARRVHMATGYYKHEQGYRPDFPGEEDFAGTIIHPQEWPRGLEVVGKRIVIVGSGATAVTLVPALHDVGAKVTMLQRTPTWIGPLPAKDVISAIWKRLLPEQAAYTATRVNHSIRDMAQYVLAQRAPILFKAALWALQRRWLSPAEIRAHFRPSYRPWDQRVCKAPDGDIFQAIKGGAQVVTARIDRFVPEGIVLDDGRLLGADIIVSATGLDLEIFGSAALEVDGRELEPAECVTYRGLMLADIPNLSFTTGYINASWTLRADMVSKYMVKVWRRADRVGQGLYRPVPSDRGQQFKGRMMEELDAGYIKRSGHKLPRQGTEDPWHYTQNIIRDYFDVERGDIAEEMVFGAVPAQ